MSPDTSQPQTDEHHCQCSNPDDGICGARCGSGDRCSFCRAYCKAPDPIPEETSHA